MSFQNHMTYFFSIRSLLFWLVQWHPVYFLLIESHISRTFSNFKSYFFSFSLFSMKGYSIKKVIFCHDLLAFMFQTNYFLLWNIRYLEKSVYWVSFYVHLMELCFNVICFPKYLVFCIRKECTHAWNDMKMSKLWHHFYFWVDSLHILSQYVSFILPGSVSLWRVQWHWVYLFLILAHVMLFLVSYSVSFCLSNSI